nr:glycoside hydrolase family 71 protein [Armatimonadota bacterium]
MKRLSIFVTFSASGAFAFLALGAHAAPAAPKVANTRSSTQTAALNAQTSRLQALDATPNGEAKTLPTSVYGHPFVNAFNDNSPGGPHLIFAHMQMSAGDYGKHYYGTAPSVADYTKDILEAKAAGIDGFACNIGGADASYQSARNNLGQAIDEVNASNAGKSNSVGVSNFYFFDQLDFSTFPQDTSKILAELNAAISHPSYYHYKGRPWFGTYAGEGGTYAQVSARFATVIA